MLELKRLEQLLIEGRISRREFLAKVTALGFAAALSPTLLSTPAHAAKPKRGGRFRVGITGFATTNTLDPALLDDIGNYFINWSLRNNLVEVDYKGEAIPELAESWEANSDATQWIFRLRKGVEFHNGKSFEAEDVVDSINHHRKKDTKSGAKALMDQVEDVRADSKHMVIFKLTGGNADFPYILNDYHLTIQQAGTAGKQFDEGIGTAGYVLKSFEPGVRAFMTRNPNYWKEGRAHFDEVEVIGIADVNARTNALKTGRIDFMNRCELKTVHLLKKTPGIRIIRVNSTFHYTLPMFTDVAPFDNNDVRLALKYAINREEIVKKMLRGYGTVGNDHPIAPLMKYHATDLPQRTYDPDKAQYHLKKAGLSNLTVKLHTAPIANFIDAALLYKEQSTKAGITVDVVQEPTDGYWSNVWLKKPFVSCYWNGRATVDWMLSTSYSGAAPWNDSHFHHARFDKLLTEARAELDQKKRAAMYFECQKILRDEGGVIVYLFKDNVEAVNDKIKFDNIAGNWEADGSKASERWWFA